MPRRVYTYGIGDGWMSMNVLATMGGVLMGIGFLILVYNIYYSFRYSPRETTGDPWNARTLEWATPAPVPHYNFAHLPEVKGHDAFWIMKEEIKQGKKPEKKPYKPIHMPSYSGVPVVMSVFFFIAGFGMVFSWNWMSILGLIGVLATMVIRSFDYDKGFYVSVEEIEEHEKTT